jgi:iron complex outermembrane receptor protein
MDTASIIEKTGIFGYFVDGEIRLPGALTEEEFAEDPFQADPLFVDRDAKRISTKGRLGIRFTGKWGSKLNNEVEITTYGTIKSFVRTSSTYRIISRYGLGFIARYMNSSTIFGNTNELSFGGDLLLQPARTEFYKNINGEKGDQLLQLLDEEISNSGFYVSNSFEILKNRFYVLLTARYDNVGYALTEETLPSRSDERTFKAFTPKLAFNYKLSPFVSVYTSYGFSFDSPAKNELDSVDPSKLYNNELEAQKSENFELGIKGNVIDHDAYFIRKILFTATFFTIGINNEIVPFEVFGDVFFRNAAKTTRTGLELGGELEIIPRLKIASSYTYSDFNYDEYFATTIQIDSTGITETDQDFSGNIVPSVPKHNLYLSLSYAQPFSAYTNAFIRVSYMGVSGLWVNDANSSKTDAYNLLNTVLGFDIILGSFNLMLSAGVNNIFDLVYVGFTNTNSANSRFYESGEPRNFFGSLNIGYNF